MATQIRPVPARQALKLAVLVLEAQAARESVRSPEWREFQGARLTINRLLENVSASAPRRPSVHTGQLA